MSPENFIKGEVCSFAYQEAFHVGGWQAMLAVACVLRNRVRKGWGGGNWLEVLSQAAESSAMEPRPRTRIELSSPAFRRVLQEVDDVFLGVYRDELTSGGLYYMDSLFASHGHQLRPWFAEKILAAPDHHPRVAQVGGLFLFS